MATISAIIKVGDQGYTKAKSVKKIKKAEAGLAATQRQADFRLNH
jgi:hypothetical protein